MIRELNHVGIHVRNADASIAFYTGTLGGKITRDAMIPASQTRCLYIQVADGVVELLHRGDGQVPPKFGYSHLAWLVDSLDAEYDRLAAAGFEFSVPPRVAGSGSGRVAFFSDPNGVRTELVERSDNYRIQPFIAGQFLSFDHISLVADKLDAAERFYLSHMGMWPLKRMYIESRQLTMLYLSHGSDVIELLHKPTAQNTPDLIGHLAFRVADVDATGAWLKERGVQIEPGSPKPAGTGIGRVCVFRDPDGNKIEILDRKDLRAL